MTLAFLGSVAHPQEMNLPTTTKLVERFYTDARFALDNGYVHITLQPGDIVRIANLPATRSGFRDEFRRINDPESQAHIKDYLGDVINDLESAAERSEIKVDLIDRVGMTPSAAITVAGVVALAGATASVALVAPFLLAGGLIGLAFSGVGRTLLRSRAQRNKADSRKVKQLKDSL